MNIEAKLKEVNEYFKNKVLKGDYEFLECTEHTASVLIDQKHKFTFWTSNDPKYNFDFYMLEPNEYGYIGLKLTTQEERLTSWRKMKPHVLKYKNEILKKKKQEELKRLEVELSKLSN